MAHLPTTAHGERDATGEFRPIALGLFVITERRVLLSHQGLVAGRRVLDARVASGIQ